MTKRILQWWQSGIIYHIYPRSFQDGNGDGIGDLTGIISRLDYLSHTLGIDALWLSPIYPSPMADFGYDIADYRDVDPIFGALDTFDLLVREAHQRNLKVIIDYVPNHTSDQHKWFGESRSSRTAAKRNWYVWADPQEDGTPPNNWLSVFGGPAWSWDATTEQYYLHSFLSSMPDLNWRNPAVQHAMFEVVRFWLDRGVDGLRIDTAHYIMKDHAMRDNPSNQIVHTTFHKSFGAYDTQLHLYDKGDADVHNVFRDLRHLLDSYGQEQPRIALGEIHIFDVPTWASYYGEQLDELHMPCNFGLLNTPWQAQAIRQAVDTLESTIPACAWPNYVLGNHDEHRIATRIGAAQARVGMLLLLTLRGTPTLYYGDELGMENVPIAPEHERDPWGIHMPGLGLGRDPERTPMQWEASPHAGFCHAEVAPWLPVAANATTMNVATQLEDPQSFLSLTRKLIDLRRSSLALSGGSYRALESTSTNCFVYMRETADERWIVALNTGTQDQILNVTCAGDASIILSTYLDRQEHVDLATLALRGNEGGLIQLT